MNKKIKAAGFIMMAMLVSTMQCGCSNSDDGADGAEQSSIISVDDSKLYEEVNSFIHGEEIIGPVYFGADLDIAPEDIYTNFDILGKYNSNNVIYLKLKVTVDGKDDYCTFRFQLSNNNQITSYIKYMVEA